MRVYVATRFDYYRHAQHAADLLIQAGHTPTARWPRIAQQLGGQHESADNMPDAPKDDAKMDLSDIDDADAILVLVPETGGTGMWFELGYALGKGKRCMTVFLSSFGRGRSIFLSVTEQFDHLAEAITSL